MSGAKSGLCPPPPTFSLMLNILVVASNIMIANHHNSLSIFVESPSPHTEICSGSLMCRDCRAWQFLFETSNIFFSKVLPDLPHRPGDALFLYNNA